MEKNADEWTRREEINMEEIPCCKLCLAVWLYTDLLQALKGERLSCVFSLEGTLIFASAAPHCGAILKEELEYETKHHTTTKKSESLFVKHVILC